MNNTIMVQFIKALHKLSEQELDEIVSHRLIQIIQMV